MTFQQFLECMKPMVKVYGANRYPDERLEYMYEHLSGIPYSDFEKGIKRLIATEVYPPMLDKLKDAFINEIANAKIQAAEAFEKRHEGSHCRACGNTGVVSLKRADGPSWEQSYAFKCSCPRGEFYDFAYPSVRGAKGFVSIERFYQSQESVNINKLHSKKPSVPGMKGMILTKNDLNQDKKHA